MKPADNYWSVKMIWLLLLSILNHVLLHCFGLNILYVNNSETK